ncbi:MAG: 2-succinyl-6-hydroxy-2,4-cyclohexadiene-1-carboxylate synthase [candidate division WS2 bacterium]|nr:2-succinyl-6-hydroxy-2,4-cyclohexadiene-1-carboxylate synthase [Candidatus Lithacetigena glycinireducens]
MNFKMLWKALLILILFLLFTSFWGFYISIKPPKIVSDITPKDLGLDYEKVSFVTSDGIKLIGWWLPNKNPTAKTLILLHGYPADKGNILPALSFLAEKYNLLLFDFRYLGESGGKYSTAGAKETEDLQAAINFLKSRGISEVGVWGFSMSGAVALMTAPETPEIKAIVSESSYAGLDLMTLELYRIPILKYPLAYLTGFWTKIILGIDLKNISPAQSAKNLKIPVLLIHSKNDEVIPFRHAKLLQKALKDNLRAEFWFEENLMHGQFGEEYQKRIEDFFGRNL